MKASFQLILGANLVIILGLAVVLRIQDNDSPIEGKGAGFVISLAVSIFIQFFVNSLFGLIAHTSKTRQNFFLAALLTLLIGFSACIGGTFSY